MRTMKIAAAAIVMLLLVGVCDEASAQNNFGAGFVFGDPTGIAWQYRFSRFNTLDGGFGFSPFDRFRIHVDYLWNSYPFREQHLYLYYGVGAAVGFGRAGFVFVDHRNGIIYSNEEAGFAARVPVGLAYLIPRSPVEIFLEVAPLMIFTPVTDFGADVGLGGRIYF